VPRQVESAVTERSQDALGGSSSATGATLITCARRQHALYHEVGATASLAWRKAAYHGDSQALSTVHKPLQYWFI
jgi:hypothetical protein